MDSTNQATLLKYAVALVIGFIKSKSAIAIARMQGKDLCRSLTAKGPAQVFALHSEAIFATSHLLGFSYAPRIKNLKRQRLYIFNSRRQTDGSTWKILPTGYVDSDRIILYWDDILRFIGWQSKKCSIARGDGGP